VSGGALGERLLALADEIKGKRVLDIGTDHGKIPAFAVSSGKCKTAVAADVNEEPLLAAKQTAERFGVTERIEFIRSNGFDNIDTEDVSDIVIAGMGGETIAGILQRGEGKINGKNLILQAMSKSDLLFDCLVSDGYRFKKIASITEDGRDYTYFVCEKSSAEAGVTVRDIYNAMNVIAPFENAAEWDNSGVLVGRADGGPVSSVLTCTDITTDTVFEAVWRGANVIVSHHPVIGFDPLKKISYPHPAALASAREIICICSHTPFDLAHFGMNRLFLKTFEAAVSGYYDTEHIEKITEETGYGVVFSLKTPHKTSEIAAKLKTALGTNALRFSGEKLIKRAAFCSGSGSSYIGKIIDEDLADLYITGDIKQAGFVDAANADLSLIDAGHWGTEHAFADFIREYLMSSFPDLIVTTYDKEPFTVF
jgi:dinuclear metal center YbgI/SA1388 family protein